MENQHRKIKGYRELDQTEIDLMNEIKAQGQSLGLLIERLNERMDVKECDSLVEGSESESRRWVAIGRTHLQQGLMALTRSVAKPDFF